MSYLTRANVENIISRLEYKEVELPKVEKPFVNVFENKFYSLEQTRLFQYLGAFADAMLVFHEILEQKLQRDIQAISTIALKTQHEDLQRAKLNECMDSIYSGELDSRNSGTNYCPNIDYRRLIDRIICDSGKNYRDYRNRYRSISKLIDNYNKDIDPSSKQFADRSIVNRFLLPKPHASSGRENADIRSMVIGCSGNNSETGRSYQVNKSFGDRSNKYVSPSQRAKTWFYRRRLCWRLDNLCGIPVF